MGIPGRTESVFAGRPTSQENGLKESLEGPRNAEQRVLPWSLAPGVYFGQSSPRKPPPPILSRPLGMPATLRGQFLIAGPRLRDPNFFKSAVLIVEHNEEGAMGLVINRPSSVSVKSALSGHFDLPPSGGFVYQGGPVEQTALFILHNSQSLDPEETPVIPDLLIGSCAEVFETVVRESIDDPAIQYRIYSGCSGWGSGQLESEMERGDWLTIPADLDQIFSDDPYAVWETLMGQVHKAHRIIPNHPSNPEWN